MPNICYFVKLHYTYKWDILDITQGQSENAEVDCYNIKDILYMNACKWGSNGFLYPTKELCFDVTTNFTKFHTLLASPV